MVFYLDVIPTTDTSWWLTAVVLAGALEMKAGGLEAEISLSYVACLMAMSAEKGKGWLDIPSS